MSDTYTRRVGRNGQDEGASVAMFMLGYFLGSMQSDEGRQIFRRCGTSVEHGVGYVRFVDSGSLYKIAVECIEPPRELPADPAEPEQPSRTQGRTQA